jgi:tetratricopeptide (TPR) repeat protein
MSLGKKPTIFAPTKAQKTYFMTEIFRPYFGTHPYHEFPELEGFANVLLANECLKRLYDLTIDNLNMHSYKDAIFFCDKLLTLSNSHLAIVYLMGECYFRNGDYKKVHSLFETHKTLSHNISFQLLAARALLHNKQYDQCLTVLNLQL